MVCAVLISIIFCSTIIITIIPKRVLEWKPTGRRNTGRPRKRWTEDIEEDIQIMGIRGWRKLCKERAEWKRIAEKTETYSGL